MPLLNYRLAGTKALFLRFAYGLEHEERPPGVSMGAHGDNQVTGHIVRILLCAVPACALQRDHTRQGDNMKIRETPTILRILPAMLLLTTGVPAWAGVEGTSSTLYGYAAGFSRSDTTGGSDTFLGAWSGYYNTSFANTIVGYFAGYNNVSGHGNVFVGNGAGTSELGSNKLYLDNCLLGSLCDAPFIYGEFDNHLLKINGVTHVAADGAAKSQMHFSLDQGDYGGFLTSVLPNNFFVSSGARFDSPNWVQLSPDGNAVMAGSGGVGYRIFTHTGTTVGNTFNNPTLRLHIDYSGQFGINTAPVNGHEIHTATGAYEAGGTWVDGSSRELKDNVRRLSTEDAVQALAALDPVTFNYKTDPAWHHVGFIAEDVPQLVAAPDRKGLAPMDIVAVLTKVVQEKSRIVDEQKKALAALTATVSRLETAMARLGHGQAATRP
jgi:hypothetical protein